MRWPSRMLRSRLHGAPVMVDAAVVRYVDHHRVGAECIQ